MSVDSYEGLKAHIGHVIDCAPYAGENVVLECCTCNVILVSYDRASVVDEAYLEARRAEEDADRDAVIYGDGTVVREDPYDPIPPGVDVGRPSKFLPGDPEDPGPDEDDDPFAGDILKYRAAAKRDWATEDLAVDDDADVSLGDDDGAWVEAWVWVTASSAGVDPLQ